MFLLLAATASAAPLNPWGAATPPGEALVSPYVSLGPDAIDGNVFGAVGLAERLDLHVGLGSHLPREGTAYGMLEVLPRYFLVPQVALAPHVFWTPGADALVPAAEVHVDVATGRFSLVANVGWHPVVASSGASLGSLTLLAAPEVRLSERFSVYVEVDPTLSLVGDPLALTLVPGFGMGLDPGARHGVSVGLQIPTLPEVAPASLGFWYCFTFASG